MILTLGDSFTYGDELTDRTAAWPYLLGKMFRCQINNMAVSGGSNDRMFRLAVSETAKTRYNLVIIAWSEVSRFEAYESDRVQCFTHQATSPEWVVEYYRHGYDDKLAHERWFTNMLALQAYFKSIQQPYLFCTIGEVLAYKKYCVEFDHILFKLDKSYMTSWPIEGFLSWQGDCPKGPRGHPLELGHERIANKLANYIRELNLL